MEKSKASAIMKRVLTSLVLAPLVLWAVYSGSPMINLLALTGGALLAWEWANMMFRVVVAKDAFKAMKINPKAKGKFRLKVNDLQAPWNHQVFELIAENGTLDVKEWGNAKAYDFEVSIQRLSQLVLGFMSGEEAIQLEVVNIKNQNKIELLKKEFIDKNWISQPQIFDNDTNAYAKFDFFKDRVGIEVQFGHSSFIGIDLIKFQIASYSNLDKIDFGVYITTTSNFQKYIMNKYNLKWEGSLTYEKVVNYLPHIKSAIQVPIYVIGIDI